MNNLLDYLITRDRNCRIRKKRCSGKIRWEMIMFTYSFLLMLFSHIFSLSRDGQKQIFKEYCLIIVVCLVAVEILNQITFLWSRMDRKRAIAIKCVAFWLIFTVGILAYIYLTSRLQKADSWNWHDGIISLVIYLVLSWVLPAYSLSPDIRFLFLYGRYKPK